ncbi:MAG: N-acetyltransferase [Chloroflexi bacterium]|nr:MAG: N-acetyltransferase [Chloroflexota bacterium]
MGTDLFKGKLVRLCADEPDVLAEVFSRWGRNSEYIRLLDNDPAKLWSAKKFKEWIEKELDQEGTVRFTYMIHTIEADKLIGFVSMWGFDQPGSEAWVGIGMGEPEFWGRGYGTEAMQLILQYAFQELNLHRVTLGVFEYNQRAIRSYEKAGFIHEGRIRKEVLREGKRWDALQMGILREEWAARVNGVN